MKIFNKNEQNTFKKFKKIKFTCSVLRDQTKWKTLKYDIRLFTISFSKKLAQLREREQSAIENSSKILESILKSSKMLEEYNKRKKNLKLMTVYQKVLR